MDIVFARRMAYAFIRNWVICNVSSVRDNISDSDLADVLGGTSGLYDALVALKNGDADPASSLVERFTNLAGQGVLKSDIDVYLVTPFVTNS